MPLTRNQFEGLLPNQQLAEIYALITNGDTMTTKREFEHKTHPQQLALIYEALANTGFAGDNTPTEVSGTALLKVFKHFARPRITGDTVIDFEGWGTSHPPSGNYTIVLDFKDEILHTVTFGDRWVASDTSDIIFDPTKIYVIKATVVDGETVNYHIEGYSLVNEIDLTDMSIFLADHGEDTDTNHTLIGQFVVNQGPQGVFLGGDNNYPVGSTVTMDDNLASIQPLITALKVWPCTGNHDLDTYELDFNSEVLLVDDAAGAFTWGIFLDTPPSDWLTNLTSPLTGETQNSGGLFGFGDGDIETQITNDAGSTYYFRFNLNTTGLDLGSHVFRFTMVIDDGVRISFGNSTEVRRLIDLNVKVPVTDLSTSHETVAPTQTNGIVWTERGVVEFLVPADVLKPNDNNIFGFEVKQSSSTSTDMAFKCKLEIGTTLDAIPAVTDDSCFLIGYAQPMINKFPYVHNACRYYKKAIGNFIDLFVLSDGIRSDGLLVEPEWLSVDGRQHEWFAEQLALSTRPHKIVMFHRPFVAPTTGSLAVDTRLAWPEFFRPGLLIMNGHSHQSWHIQHTSGLHIINASNVGRTPRAQSALQGATSGASLVWFNNNINDQCVAVLRSNAQYLQVKFTKIDETVLHSFLIPAS